MEYKIYLPIPRVRDTQSFFVSAHGSLMSSNVPEISTPGEVAFYRYTDTVRIPSFRIELKHFCTLDVYPTTVKFYFPYGDGFEPLEIGSHSLIIPVYFDAPGARQPKHVVVTDVGHVWVLFTQQTKADLIYFMSTAGSPAGDAAIATGDRECIGHVRYGFDVPRLERILDVMAIETAMSA